MKFRVSHGFILLISVTGLFTPGGLDTAAQLPRFHIPEDLTGKTVLDIGAWEGFYSSEACPGTGFLVSQKNY